MNFIQINNILSLFSGNLQLTELIVIIASVFTVFGLVVLYLIESFRADKYKKLYKDHKHKLKVERRLKSNYENELKTFANLLDEITFPIWQRDKDLNIVYCNSKFCEVVDEIRSDVMKKSSVELYKNAKDFAATAIKTSKPQVQEQNVIIDGAKTLSQIVEIPVSNRLKGNVAKSGTIGFALNFSELQTTRERLRSNVELQNRLLESLASAVAIYDSNHRLEYFNKSFVSLFKLDEDWLKTAPKYGEILDVMRERRMIPEQADFKSFKAANLKMFNDLITKKEEYYYLPDSSYIKVITIPYQQSGLLFYYEDMTSHINLERNYNTLVSVQKQTLDNLTEAVAVFGENGRLKLHNPAYENIWGHQESILKTEPHYTELLEEEKNLLNISDYEEFTQDFANKLLSRNTAQEKLVRADEIILSQKFTPLPDGGTLLTYDDISDAENIERSLRAEKQAYEETNSMKTNFLNNVSYELRSPLTSIMGFSEILLMGRSAGQQSEEKLNEYLKAIFDSSVNLKQLIDNIIDVSSIDAGYMSMKMNEVSIKKYIASFSDKITKLCSKRSVKLKLDIQAKLPKISVDEPRLKDAILNLVSNSLSFANAETELKININNIGHNIHFEFISEGKTIAKEDMHNIFDQFYRPKDNSSSTSSLGLYLAKRIVEMHSGFITVDSMEGNKTKFVFEIPCLNKQ